MTQPRKDELVDALRAAGSAHHDYETNALNGQRDAQWAGWYAAYVLGRLGDFTSPTQLSGWLASASGEDWADAAADAVLERLS